jgi:uncharacterized membrane protein YkoI
MTRLAILLLSLLLACVALACSGASTDDGAPTSKAPSAVGKTPADDDGPDDDADDEDEADEEDDEEVAVALADVPRLVLDAAKAALPGAVFTSAEMEQEQGVTVYCLCGTHEGEQVEIEVSADGKVLEIERE